MIYLAEFIIKFYYISLYIYIYILYLSTKYIVRKGQKEDLHIIYIYNFFLYNKQKRQWHKVLLNSLRQRLIQRFHSIGNVMNSLSVNVSLEQIDLLITVTLIMLISLNIRANFSATYSLILSSKLLFFLSLSHTHIPSCMYICIICVSMHGLSRQTIPFVSFTSLCVLGNLTSTQISNE